MVQLYFSCSSRAQALPSPPLPPVPQVKWIVDPAGSSEAMTLASAVAARSMTSMEGTPEDAKYRASPSRMAWGVMSLRMCRRLLN